MRLKRTKNFTRGLQFTYKVFKRNSFFQFLDKK